MKKGKRVLHGEESNVVCEALSISCTVKPDQLVARSS